MQRSPRCAPLPEHAKPNLCPQRGRPSISASHRGLGESGLERRPAPRRPIIGYLIDAANLVTLAGLLCSIAAITFAVRGDFSAAAMGMVLAFFFDGIDGPVAKRLSGRTADDRAFGANIDSLVDMAGAGVTLAVVLLAYGDFGWAYVPGAFALAGATALRLSYFNVHGLDSASDDGAGNRSDSGEDGAPDKDATRSVGLPTDQAIIVFAALMLLDGPLARETFQFVLYGGAMGLVALMVSPLRIPKMTGAAFYAFNALAFAIGALHAARILA